MSHAQLSGIVFSAEGSFVSFHQGCLDGHSPHPSFHALQSTSEKFLRNFEQEVLHSHFSLGPTNYIASPASRTSGWMQMTDYDLVVLQVARCRPVEPDQTKQAEALERVARQEIMASARS